MSRDKIFEELIPTMFRLEPAQRNALRKAARAEKISGAEFLRRLIDTHIIARQSIEGDQDVTS